MAADPGPMDAKGREGAVLEGCTPFGWVAFLPGGRLFGPRRAIDCVYDYAERERLTRAALLCEAPSSLSFSQAFDFNMVVLADGRYVRIRAVLDPVRDVWDLDPSETRKVAYALLGAAEVAETNRGS